jgi:hypothetical protein
MVAADHPDITKRVFKDLTEDLMIMQMTVGNDDHEGIATKTKILQHPVERPDHKVVGIRKSPTFGKVSPVIQDRHLESNLLGQGTKR